jgi:hypothetical protein
MKVSSKMSSDIGQYFFAALAWLQVLPFVFNICENIYLLNKVKAHSHTRSEADVKQNKKQADENTHKFFQTLVALKWGISLLGTVCSIAALCFFWLAGFYSEESLPYVLIITAEIIIFFVAGKLISKRLRTVIQE